MGLSRNTQVADYEDVSVEITFDGITAPPYEFQVQGLIIEGWQKIEETFCVPLGAQGFRIRFITASTTYVDDIRLCPADGNMQSSVYDKQYRLQASLDNNNYATFYYYDEEGQLYLVEKETARGRMSLQESIGHSKE